MLIDSYKKQKKLPINRISLARQHFNLYFTNKYAIIALYNSYLKGIKAKRKAWVLDESACVQHPVLVPKLLLFF